MLRLAADENFNNDIVRGLLRRRPDLDIVRVQDVGLSGADDPAILEWAAREGRVQPRARIRVAPHGCGRDDIAHRAGVAGCSPRMTSCKLPPANCPLSPANRELGCHEPRVTNV